MKTLLSIKNFILLFFLILPYLSVAQKSIDQKVDSMKREFLKKDSIRRKTTEIDTVKNSLARSPFLLLYGTKNPSLTNNQQLYVQGIRFRNSHFLNFLLRAALVKPVIIDELSQLYITFDDRSTIVLNFVGRVESKGNGMKNSSDLNFEYSLPEDNFKLLLNKKVAALKLNYQGGVFTFNMNSEGTSNIEKACLLVN